MRIPNCSLMGPFRGHMSIKSSDRDQQKREKLIKTVEKFKKEIALIHSTPPCHSRSVPTKNHKRSPNHLNLVSRERSSPLRKEEHHPTRDSILSRTYRSAVQPCTLPLSLSPGKLCHIHKKKKATSGDLLDTHADWFTERKQPFTPKLLKTASKSFLSKYRYYNHLCRKKSISPHTQSHKRSKSVYRSTDNECLRAYADDHPYHPLKKHSGNSGAIQTLLRAKNEELKYLQLLQEVTNYILLRSCYWKKSLGDIIRMHIINRCDLDEVKIQRIFQALEEDLNIYTHLPDSSELHCVETWE